MDLGRRTLIVAALLAAPAPALRAQPALDPSGHWAGTVQGQETEMPFELDLAKNAKGEIAATMTVPHSGIKGLPVRGVTVKGRTVTVELRLDQKMVGEVSADGKSFAGDFTGIGPLGNEFSTPFSLTRTGAARIEPPANLGAVSKELLGTWTGTLTADAPMRMELTLAGQAGGASGSLVNLDQGETKVPITAVTQKASQVTFEFRHIGASYAGAVSAAGAEIVGTYKQGAFSAPLTLRRAASTKK